METARALQIEFPLVAQHPALVIIVLPLPRKSRRSPLPRLQPQSLELHRLHPGYSGVLLSSHLSFGLYRGALPPPYCYLMTPQKDRQKVQRVAQRYAYFTFFCGFSPRVLIDVCTLPC
jgi:hypothetical protein